MVVGPTPCSRNKRWAAFMSSSRRSSAGLVLGRYWDAARIDAEIRQVADWAKQRNVPVICNEFGVHRPYADPQDRARWITDVRTALEHHGMGWAMWDYSGNFGVVTKEDGKTRPDEITVKALGLKVPAGQ